MKGRGFTDRGGVEVWPEAEAVGGVGGVVVRLGIVEGGGGGGGGVGGVAVRLGVVEGGGGDGGGNGGVWPKRWRGGGGGLSLTMRSE